MAPTVVNGYDAFKKLVGEAGKDSKFAYFRGDNEQETGKSWCPDCRQCDDTVLLKLGDSNIQSIVCNVGFKEEWKDEKNPFRSDDALKVTGIPTLLNLSSGERIADENELAKADVVDAFLSKH